MAIANAAPLLSTRYLPFTDTPEHTAAIATIARLMPGGGGAPYEVAFGDSQYLLFHGVGALVARLLNDALLANTLLLVVVALAWPLSARALLRALGRDERLAIFAGMVFWNRATATGLEPYVASVPLLLFSISAFVRHLRQPTWGRAVVVALLSVALFYAHVSSLLALVVIASALVAARHVAATREDAASPADRRAARATSVCGGVAAIAALLPAMIAAAMWARHGTLKTSGEGAIERMPIIDSVLAMPLWTFDVWRSHLDEVTAALWWIAYAAIVVTSWSEPRREDQHGEWHAWLPFASVLAIYLLMPTRIGDAGMLNVRLAPVLTLFALLGLQLREHRIAHAALGLALFVTLVHAADMTFEIRRVEREVAGDFDAVLASMRPDTSVALLNFEKESVRTHEWPYPFAGAYHVARGGALASFSFAELPHWSVHYAPGRRPPAHAPFWAFDPCQYRYRQDGRYYDYVLVQGDVAHFDAGSLSFGPRFAQVARAARFTLYEKLHESLRDDDRRDDVGPCATTEQ